MNQNGLQQTSPTASPMPSPYRMRRSPRQTHTDYSSTIGLSSTTSGSGSHLNATQIDDLLDQSSQVNRMKDMAKMMSVIMIPIIALIIITAISLAQSVQMYNKATEANLAIHNRIDFADLVSSLQDERGLTASYIAGGSNAMFDLQLIEAISKTQNQVGIAMDKIVRGGLWVSFTTEVGSFGETSAKFRNLLSQHRQMMNLNINMSFHINIRFYTSMTQGLLYMLARSVELDLAMWKLYVGMTSLLSAIDTLGVSRALGSSYYLNKCHLSTENKIWFITQGVLSNELIAQAFRYYPQAEVDYQNRLKNDPGLATYVLDKQNEISNLNSSFSCVNYTRDELHALDEVWLKNTTAILDKLAATKNMIRTDLVNELLIVAGVARSQLLSFGIVMGFVATLCTLLGGWYATSISRMTRRMGRFATKMRDKSAELKAEKKRTDYLLYKMLPKPVADQLKAKQAVHAEYYEMVTIFFSDIVGFTQMSARTSPHDIVKLLNSLYTMFDDIIEKFDVYKIETIGDAYMVVSGCPDRNGNNHVSEISLMSLDMIDALRHFVVQQFPFEKLQLRIGIHSGSCVSGVVGTTRPRFCLFGDTVNTASRMESTSQANKIQISQTTKDLLEGFDDFVIEYRGETEVKGKGIMKTYWLMSYDRKQKNKTANCTKRQPDVEGTHTLQIPSQDMLPDI